jgi:hypothetical protein
LSQRLEEFHQMCFFLSQRFHFFTSEWKEIHRTVMLNVVIVNLQPHQFNISKSIFLNLYELENRPDNFTNREIRFNCKGITWQKIHNSKSRSCETRNENWIQKLTLFRHP